MGESKTIIGSYKEIKPERRSKEETEIDYEAEAIELETTEVSFENLEKLDAVISGEEEFTEDAKETLNKLEGTEMGFQIRKRILSLLDQTEMGQTNGKPLADLSSILD